MSSMTPECKQHDTWCAGTEDGPLPPWLSSHRRHCARCAVEAQRWHMLDQALSRQPLVVVPCGLARSVLALAHTRLQQPPHHAGLHGWLVPALLLLLIAWVASSSVGEAIQVFIGDQVLAWSTRPTLPESESLIAGLDGHAMLETIADPAAPSLAWLPPAADTGWYWVSLATLLGWGYLTTLRHERVVAASRGGQSCRRS
jgi:hypothetical protein